MVRNSAVQGETGAEDLKTQIDPAIVTAWSVPAQSALQRQTGLQQAPSGEDPQAPPCQFPPRCTIRHEFILLAVGDISSQPPPDSFSERENMGTQLKAPAGVGPSFQENPSSPSSPSSPGIDYTQTRDAQDEDTVPWKTRQSAYIFIAIVQPLVSFYVST